MAVVTRRGYNGGRMTTLRQSSWLKVRVSALAISMTLYTVCKKLCMMPKRLRGDVKSMSTPKRNRQTLLGSLGTALAH
jgi:hypothetical protein